MNRQSGNILIYILGAILLLGLLIMLVKGSFQEGTGIDSEKTVLKAQQVQSYASELERGVNYVLRNGVSETDIKFAVPTGFTAIPIYGAYTDSEPMVFAPKGGGVEYKMPPTGVNDGTAWRFFANTHFTDLGTDDANTRKAELIAVLPNVTDAFCSQINRNMKQSIDLTANTDPSANGCMYNPGFDFVGAYSYGSTANVLDDTKLTNVPAPEACVKCASDNKLHYYKVLLVR